MATTGFQAYHTYQVVKHMHFTSKKFDITKFKKELPKREIFVNKWNEEVRNTGPSRIFFKLDRMFDNREKLIRLFAYYCVTDENFYVTDIQVDEFQLFKKYERELNNLKETLEADMAYVLSTSRTNNVPLQKILFAKGRTPYIFQMFDRGKISIHSLIAFDIAFDIHNKIDKENIDIVSQQKLKKYHQILDKYSLIVYKFYIFDVKEYLKQVYNRLS